MSDGKINNNTNKQLQQQYEYTDKYIIQVPGMYSYHHINTPTTIYCSTRTHQYIIPYYQYYCCSTRHQKYFTLRPIIVRYVRRRSFGTHRSFNDLCTRYLVGSRTIITREIFVFVYSHACHPTMCSVVLLIINDYNNRK